MVKKVNKINYPKFFEKYWLGLAAIIFILLFVILYFFFAKLSAIEYNGLTFVKEKYADLTVYRYSYYFNSAGQTYKNNVYLRTDPRENIIPVYGLIELNGKSVYLGVNNTGFAQCPDSQIALATLVQFFANNQLSVKAGTTSSLEAVEKNQTLVNCTSNPGKNTIIFEQKEPSEILRVTDSCYIVRIGSCDEAQLAVEKFVVQSIIDAKASAEPKDN